MDSGYLVDVGGAAAQFLAAAPGLAPWFQAVGSLITLLAASLIPWFSHRSRQRAFLLRAGLLIEEALDRAVAMDHAIDSAGIVEGDRVDYDRLADEFKIFPVEELNNRAAMLFHKHRVAFRSLVRYLNLCWDRTGVLNPSMRKALLRRTGGYIYLVKQGRNIFPANMVPKISKPEREMWDHLKERDLEFRMDWEADQKREKLASAGAEGTAPTLTQTHPA